VKVGPFRLRGLNTAETSAFLPPGALTTATGSRFAPDSARLRKARGRTKFNTAAPGSGFASHTALEFNTATDQLLMFQGTGAYIADVGATGTFATVKKQRVDEDAAATNFTVGTQVNPITAVRFGDSHLIADGVNKPTIISSNLRARFLGIPPPQGALTFADATVGAYTRPNAVVEAISNPGGDAIITFQNGGRAYDGIDDNYATMSVIGGDGAITETFSFLAGPGATRQLRVVLNGYDSLSSSSIVQAILNAGRPQFTYSVSLSVDSGTSYTLVRYGAANLAKTTIPYDIPGTPVLETIRVKIALSTPLGYDVDENNSASLNIYDIILATAGSVNPLSTDPDKFGIRYAYTKVRTYEHVSPGGPAYVAGDFVPSVEIESSLSQISPSAKVDALTFGHAASTITAPVNGITITRTENFESDVTHWRIYRSVEGSSNDETLAVDAYSSIAILPASVTTYRDTFSEGGFPLDYQDPTAAPPILIVGDQLFNANDPPPDATSVVGSFAGSALYAQAGSNEWWWSGPRNPDYCTSTYRADAPGVVTNFVDIGVLLIFTEQSVQSISTLPLASDSDFYPSRQIRDVSKSRGCVSRRGACIFEVPGAETLAAFVSSDGIYTTNGAQIALLSSALDWPATVSLSSLATAELLHSPNERKLILTYDDASGVRQALDFYYGGEGISVTGPRRWPADSTATVFRSNRIDVYTSNDGIVYLEEQGTVDNAALENADKRITFTATLPQFYVGEKRRLNTVSIHTPSASSVTLTVTVNTRIDGKASEAFVATLTSDFDFDGWKDISVGRECESFNVTFTSTSANFPGIDAVMFELEGDSDVSPQRISQ
jgi:hypothetical protein